MSNLIEAEIKITGTRALIWHAFGPDALPLEKQEKKGVPGNSPDEWRKTVLVTDNGQLYVKPTYIFACLREGSKYTKKNRGSIMPLVSATLQVTDDIILIDRYFDGFPNNHKFDIATIQTPPTDVSKQIFLDICGVRNPTNKARNVRYRVATPMGWKTEFHILFDKTIVSREQMEAVCIDAGRLCGLGDGRSVGYGRFQVESFQVNEPRT